MALLSLQSVLFWQLEYCFEWLTVLRYVRRWLNWPQSVSKCWWHWLLQILEGLNDLHKHYIIHRDLKPSNIMWFSADHSWKLTDLDNWGPANVASPVAYTLMYAPPEVVAADVHGEKEVVLETSADMWSFGIIAYELTTGATLCWCPSSPLKRRMDGIGNKLVVFVWSIECAPMCDGALFSNHRLCGLSLHSPQIVLHNSQSVENYQWRARRKIVWFEVWCRGLCVKIVVYDICSNMFWGLFGYRFNMSCNVLFWNDRQWSGALASPLAW